MSFDLSLNKGDLKVGTTGELATVQDTDKLVQDVLKVIHTPVGSNPFYPSLGSNITSFNIGMTLNKDFLESRVEASLLETIQTLQAIQRRQEAVQIVTAAEKIVRINEVIAQVDSEEPRQFNISISVASGEITDLTLPTFSISNNTLGEP
jgi:phage baseplate assembly protein W